MILATKTIHTAILTAITIARNTTMHAQVKTKATDIRKTIDTTPIRVGTTQTAAITTVLETMIRVYEIHIYDCLIHM
jgi:hypothetical protein